MALPIIDPNQPPVVPDTLLGFDQPPAAPAAPANPPAAPSPIIVGGKTFSSPEELAKSYEELQKLHGDHSRELGAVRQEIAALRQPAAAPVDQDVQMEQQLAALDQQLDSGQITATQYQRTREQMVAESVAASVTQKVTAQMSAQQGAQQFKSEHPEFDSLLQSGQLEQFFMVNKQRLGLKDEYDTYFAFALEQEKASKGAEIEAAVAVARKQVQAEIEAAAKGAGSPAPVLPNAGQGMQSSPDRTLSARERQDGMLSAFRGVK